MTSPANPSDLAPPGVPLPAPRDQALLRAREAARRTAQDGEAASRPWWRSASNWMEKAARLAEGDAERLDLLWRAARLALQAGDPPRAAALAGEAQLGS